MDSINNPLPYWETNMSPEEKAKCQEDMLLAGKSFYKIDADGNLKHVPLAEIYEERSNG